MQANFRKRLLLVTAAAALFVSLLPPVSALSMAATAAVTAPSAEARTASERQSYGIVVIGDSVAAGYQQGFTEQSVPYGYGEHVYEQALLRGLRAEYGNYGMIGLTSAGLGKWLKAAEAGRVPSVADIQPGIADPRAEALLGQTGKLAADLGNAELILITIGGNDFLNLLRMLGTEKEYSGLTADERRELDEELASVLESYEAELASILQTLQVMSPDAEVVVANQYLPIPSARIGGKITYYFPETSLQFVKEGQRELAGRLDAVAGRFRSEEFSVAIADAASVIEADANKYTAILREDIHPTALGYAELGKAYAKLLWGEYRTLKPKAEGVPISVVVNGHEIDSPYPPVLRNGRTFLPIRDITDAVGAELTWDAATNTASVQLDGRKVDIAVGASTIAVNGEPIPLEADPAYFEWVGKEKKTYVPIAALTDGLGFQVVYRGTLKAAIING